MRLGEGERMVAVREELAEAPSPYASALPSVPLAVEKDELPDFGTGGVAEIVGGRWRIGIVGD